MIEYSLVVWEIGVLGAVVVELEGRGGIWN